MKKYQIILIIAGVLILTGGAWWYLTRTWETPPGRNMRINQQINGQTEKKIPTSNQKEGQINSPLKVSPKTDTWPEIKDPIVKMDKYYSSGIFVVTEQDVEKVFNLYISWAKANNRSVLGMTGSSDWKYRSSSIYGIYERVKYWKVETSFIQDGALNNWLFYISEEGDVVQLLLGT